MVLRRRHERRCLPSCSGRRTGGRPGRRQRRAHEVLSAGGPDRAGIAGGPRAPLLGSSCPGVRRWIRSAPRARPSPRRPRRHGRPPDRQRGAAHLWGTDEVRDFRSGRPPAGVDRHPGGAGRGPGGAGHHPAVVVGGHRRARLWRSSRPRSGGGRGAAHLPLHARLHRGVEGDPACRCRGARVLRRHRAGPDRHVDGAGVPARDGHRLAGPAYPRPPPDRVGPHASIHGHGRSDPCPARRAGDVRLEGGVVGRRGRPAPRPPGRRPSALAGRPARWRRGGLGVLRR